MENSTEQQNCQYLLIREGKDKKIIKINQKKPRVEVFSNLFEKEQYLD